jgi:hypothetical protein
MIAHSGSITITHAEKISYHPKGLEIKIIDLLTIDLCARVFPGVILPLSWGEFYPQYPHQPEGFRA